MKWEALILARARTVTGPLFKRTTPSSNRRRKEEEREKEKIIVAKNTYLRREKEFRAAMDWICSSESSIISDDRKKGSESMEKRK